VNLSLNNLRLLKEENTPIAMPMNTNSFPDSQFPWCPSCSFWYTLVIQDVARKLWAMSIIGSKCFFYSYGPLYCGRDFAFLEELKPIHSRLVAADLTPGCLLSITPVHHCKATTVNDFKIGEKT
jgi:hypothetical protein